LRSYDKRKLEFTSAEALEYIETAQALTGIRCKKKEYLHDLIDAVALLVQDGIQIVYAHRSFQEYFAARFICEARSKVQEQLLKRYTRHREFVHSDNVLSMVYEMRPELVETQYLIPELDRFFAAIKLKDPVSAEAHERYLRLCFREFVLTEQGLFTAGATRTEEGGAFLQVVIFALHKCSDFTDAIRKSRKQAELEVVRKYLPAKAHQVRIVIDKDSQAAALIADLASVPNSWFSLDALRALKAAYDGFVEKVRVGQESIDEILKAR
jgi:hypothetical protein